MINILEEKIKKLQSPIVVGLDPQLSFIPECIREEAYKQYGKTPKAVAEAFYTFNKQLIDSIYDIVPAVKPQIAMYEQYGPEGVIAYQKTINYAKEKGMIVIGDIKRGDIASTAQAYAIGHVGNIEIDGEKFKGFESDFVTINPYMGYDAIKPFLDICKQEKKGMFILVKTSNPSSGDFQDLKIGEDYLYEIVAKKVDEWGQAHMGENYSYLGAVVGATYPEMGIKLRQIMPKTFFLVPGYGAQGGKAEDIAKYFNNDGTGVIVNSSRGIIAAHQNEKYSHCKNDVGKAAREATLDMKEALQKAVFNIRG